MSNKDNQNVKPKSRTRIYGVWLTMLRRCSSTKDRAYNRYGGRGIKVCDDWHTFETFRDWAMKTGYDENAPFMQCQLDRIDNNKGYCPENCRWATAEEQALNKRIYHKNTSGYSGVRKVSRKWHSQINIDKRTRSLGYYDTKKEAVDVRNNFIRANNLPYKIQEWHGE